MNTGVPRAALSSMAFWTNWFISATASTALSFQAAPSGETPTGNNVFRKDASTRWRRDFFLGFDSLFRGRGKCFETK